MGSNRWLVRALALLGFAGMLCLSPLTNARPPGLFLSSSNFYNIQVDDGAYLKGAAEVIRAQGQFLKDNQEARLISQEVLQEKIKTRRSILEQWLWEREYLPTFEDERQRQQLEALRRSQYNPPITEIWSAKALNTLLQDAVTIYADVPAGQYPLSEALLARINVTTGYRGANIGLLKGGRLRWPILLYAPAFTSELEFIDQTVALVIRQTADDTVDPQAFRDLQLAVKDLRRKLIAEARRSTEKEVDWTPTMYMDARSYLEQLDSALVALQQPDAARYFSNDYAARGSTVAELVQYMKANGLEFAPATPGSYAEYKALYYALRDYDVQGRAARYGNKPERQPPDMDPRRELPFPNPGNGNPAAPMPPAPPTPRGAPG
ncbi:MAG: hypothetical protein ACK4RK_21430 [Gemmataceae bacterium]